jgi:hypothetical protein
LWYTAKRPAVDETSALCLQLETYCKHLAAARRMSDAEIEKNLERWREELEELALASIGLRGYREVEHKLEVAQVCFEAIARRDEVQAERWTCQVCDEINRWRREQCHNCGAARTSDGPTCEADEQMPPLFSADDLSETEKKRAQEAQTETEREAVGKAIARVREYKETGKAAFREGDYVDAMDSYVDAHAVLREVTAVDVSGAAEIQALEVALQLNMARAMLKMGEAAVELSNHTTAEMFICHILGYVDNVLKVEPGNTKALHRRKKAQELRVKSEGRRRANEGLCAGRSTTEPRWRAG